MPTLRFVISAIYNVSSNSLVLVIGRQTIVARQCNKLQSRAKIIRLLIFRSISVIASPPPPPPLFNVENKICTGLYYKLVATLTFISNTSCPSNLLAALLNNFPKNLPTCGLKYLIRKICQRAVLNI